MPVQVTFDRTPSRLEPFGTADLDKYDNGPYVLEIRIADPDGKISASFDNAMSRAVLSGFNFHHLRCVRERDHSQLHRTDYQAQAAEDRVLLTRVEEGEQKLNRINFDRVFFEDHLLAKAPKWSWDRQSLSFDSPTFQNEKTAQFRRNHLK